jgi:hypothetical protein
MSVRRPTNLFDCAAASEEYEWSAIDAAHAGMVRAATAFDRWPGATARLPDSRSLPLF